MFIFTLTPTNGSVFLLILIFSLIILLPLLIFSKITKFKLISFTTFSKIITTLLLISILELITYSIVDLLSYNPEDHNVIRAKRDINSISQYIELFGAENYSYPTTKEGLQALVTDPETDKYKNWRKYLKRTPKDPWGYNYQYVNPGTHGEFDIYSLGPDGVQSEDDIGNWQLDE